MAGEAPVASADSGLGILLRGRVLDEFAGADLLEGFQIGPECAGTGEDEADFGRVEVLSENVAVVRIRASQGLDQQLGALRVGVALHLIDVGSGLAEDLGALGLELGNLELDGCDLE